MIFLKKLVIPALLICAVAICLSAVSSKYETPCSNNVAPNNQVGASLRGASECESYGTFKGWPAHAFGYNYDNTAFWLNVLFYLIPTTALYLIFHYIKRSKK